MVASVAPVRFRRRSTSHRVRGRVARKRAAISKAPSLPGGSRGPVRARRDGRMRALLGLADALHADLDRGDPGPDLVLDLGRDLRVGLEEVARVLAPLPQAGLALVEPGARLWEHPR